MTRHRAADDFATIRARMEELRRERAETLAADDESRAVIGPRSAISSTISVDRSKISLLLRRLMRTTNTR